MMYNCVNSCDKLVLSPKSILISKKKNFVNEMLLKLSSLVENYLNYFSKLSLDLC